jgi:transcriptional regulator with XRE-family HTH domain
MVRKSRQTLPPSDQLDVDLTPRALTKQEFGRRLFALMMSRSMSQSDLSRAASIGRDSVSTYVNGKTFPTPQALKKLADALGVQPEELLPNGMMSAMEDEHPAVELRQAAGHADKAWLRVNRAMSFATAAKIIALIDEEDNS